MKTYSLFLVVISLFLTSCADTLSEREGIEIDIVPLKHTYSIQLKQQQKTYEEIDEYIEQNWDMLARADLELVVLSDNGQTLADYIYSLVKRKGKDPLEVKISEKAKFDSDGDFDLQIVSFVYKTITPVCDYYQLGRIGETNLGCSVENARWKSMTDPQRMIK